MASEDISKDSFRKRVAHNLFRAAQLLFAPGDYARDEEIRARNEIEKRIEFFLVNDLNKDPAKESDNPDNLTDEERLHYFGKKYLTRDDITWEALDNILRPKNVRNAMFRVNEALQGSHINEHFSTTEIKGGEREASITTALYAPRTVTLYDNEAHAKTAAKLLRILTKGSRAVIWAEHIERGTREKAWVVSDNMNLETHNALRLVFRHLAHKQTPEQRAECTQKAQHEVNARLQENEKWEAQEGVGTFLTLAGRPGVKMYKTLKNGKDDPEDVKAVDKLPHQSLPRYVKGVPHRTVFSPDGRRYVNPDNHAAIIGHILLGPDGYAFVTTGSRRALGHVITKESEFLMTPATSKTVFAKGKGVAEAVDTVPSKIQEVAIGLVSVVGVGTAMLVCTGSYKACQKIAKLVKKGGTFDPLNTHFRPYIERKYGDPNMPQFKKNWSHRQTGSALDVSAEEVLNFAIVPIHENIPTALGEVQVLPIEKVAGIQWVDSLKDNVGVEFCKFMDKERLWPLREDYKTDDHERNLHLPKEVLDQGFYDTRRKLGMEYAKWVEESRSHYEAANPHYSPAARVTPKREDAMDEPSKALAARLNEYVKSVQNQHGLPGDTANNILNKTREALRKGMEAFLQQQRPLMVNMP